MAITKGYLTDTVTGETLTFQYNPQPIRDNDSLALNSIPVPSASHPRVTPGAPGNRDISFQLKFHRDSDDTGEIPKKASWLKSLRYPSEGSSFQTYRAPIIIFNFGKFYRIACYLKSINMIFDHYFEPETLEPWFLTADVVLTEAPDADLTSNMIRRRGAFNVVR